MDRHTDNPAIFRALCLDGGGMRGVFTAAFIACIEERIGDRIANHVDLIAGTSTGGLIALGLAAGRSGQEMLDLYRENGARIFSGKLPGRGLFMPKYSRRGLDGLLQAEFGDLRMRDLSTAACISAYEAVSGQPRVFKTDHAEGLYWGHDQLVWKVAAATSAAPSYFAPVQFTEEDAHVDGGVWANNPSMIAITEAVHRLKRSLEDVRLVSVGAVSPRPRINSFGASRWMGKPRWLKPALALLQGGPALGNHFQAKLLLAEGNYLRCDDDSSSPVALDDVAECGPLAALGHNVALQRWPDVQRLLQLQTGGSG
jgi:predicted acylesterase/phospholipase RssA